MREKDAKKAIESEERKEKKCFIKFMAVIEEEKGDEEENKGALKETRIRATPGRKIADVLEKSRADIRSKGIFKRVIEDA